MKEFLKSPGGVDKYTAKGSLKIRWIPHRSPILYLFEDDSKEPLDEKNAFDVIQLDSFSYPELHKLFAKFFSAPAPKPKAPPAGAPAAAATAPAADLAPAAAKPPPLSLAASKGKLELPEEFVQPVVEVAPDEPESTVVDGAKPALRGKDVANEVQRAVASGNYGKVLELHSELGNVGGALASKIQDMLGPSHEFGASWIAHVRAPVTLAAMASFSSLFFCFACRKKRSRGNGTPAN